jgi:demethoxyubiquinone hydroxylase (CLK1/Coq7/Cat5 family)
MQKLLIRATKEIATKLEEKLRHHYDVQLDTLGDHDNNNNNTNAIVCEIKAKVKRNWITICRFAPNENLKDILTMFEVNYELKARRI